jgi:ubiquitin carboxyl-terminal hydrolase 9/24
MFFIVSQYDVVLYINILSCDWQVVTCSGEEIASRAIELLKEVNTNLGPRLQANVLDFHESFISECMDRLRAHYDTVSVLRREMEEEEAKQGNSQRSGVFADANKLCRVMQVLHEYVAECDGDYAIDRKILPLHR